MYPYRQYITTKKDTDPSLALWREFNDVKRIPWAITRDRVEGGHEYTLWVWGQPELIADPDKPVIPLQIHVAAIQSSGNGFESKLETYIREQRRGRAA